MRSIRAGQTITLRTRFQDDLGENTEASGVFLHIFPPESDILDLDEALVVSGTPTYFDEGIFEYDFLVPDCGPGGTWTDVWYGIVNCQTLSGVMFFDVSATGTVLQLGDQLNINNLVEVTIGSGLMATDGSYLTTPLTLEFLTPTSPHYSDIRKVRLEVGGFIQNIPDFTVELSILEASLEADQISFATEKNLQLYQHARREWTTCRAALTLLSNLGSNTLRAKTLADLHVEYDSRGLQDAINKLLACLAKWEPQVISGGNAKNSQQPQGVIKGINDPDRIVPGRLWFDTDYGPADTRTPAANTRLLPSGSRRAGNIFIPRKRYW